MSSADYQWHETLRIGEKSRNERIHHSAFELSIIRKSVGRVHQLC